MEGLFDLVYCTDKRIACAAGEFFIEVSIVALFCIFTDMRRRE